MKIRLKKFAAIAGIATIGILATSSSTWAQALEKQKVSIAVGGKNLFYYLPLTIAEQLGYFKDEGLQVEISDFAGGAKALQALVGGSADVVSGAFEHTINMQAKNQVITAFVLQGRAPQIVFGVSNKTMPNYKSIADLKPGIVFGLMPSTTCGARPCSTNARSRMPLGCMISVCSKAPDTTSALPPTTACSALEPPAKSTMVTSRPSALK